MTGVQTCALPISGRTPQTGPEGNTGNSTTTQRALGISSITGPAGALIGVFLGPSGPNSSTTPSDVNMTSQAARDTAMLSPLLQQPFYVGGGTTSTGTPKKFIAPSGATRLFLGVLDYYGGNSDNTGSFAVTIF